MKLQFKYLQFASGEYLTDVFPDEWLESDYTEEEVDNYIEEYAVDLYECEPPRNVYRLIEDSADRLQEFCLKQMELDKDPTTRSTSECTCGSFKENWGKIHFGLHMASLNGTPTKTPPISHCPWCGGNVTKKHLNE